MIDESGSKKISLPPFLVRRLEAFRVAKGKEHIYVVRDKLHGTTTDFEPWQFFILEVLPGCETLEKLQEVFKERFDRDLSRKEVEVFLGSLADRKLLDTTAAQHPLLARYSKQTFEVENGKATAKSFSAAAGGSGPTAVPPPPASHGPKAEAPKSSAPPQDPPSEMDWPDPPIKLFLFDPRPMLRILAPALKPLWRFIYVAPILLFFACYIGIYRNFNLIITDTGLLNDNFSLVAHLIFAWLTVHVLSSLSAAVVATNYKVSVEKVGFYLTFGFMPRWCLKMNGARLLTRKQVMWTHSAPLFTRLILLCGGIVLWYTTRGNHDKLSELGLLVMYTCFVGLTLEAGNPLLKAHAYYILCAYLNEPRLRAKSFVAILNWLRGNVYAPYDRKALALYAMCTMLWIIGITLVIAHMLATYLLGDLHLDGSGIIVVFGFIAWMSWRTYTGLRQFGEDFNRKLQFDRWRARAIPATDTAEGEVKPHRNHYWKIAIGIGLLLCLFLPYHYEPDGQFVLFPAAKQDLTTDTPGVIDEVFFDGGEFVKKGTVLARLAHENYTATYNTLTNEIEEQKHTIANLKTLPKPEAVELAEAELKVVKEKEPYDRAKVERLRPLYAVGAVTEEELETNVKELQVDVQQIQEKLANLALVKTGPTAEEIAAAESKLLALNADRDGVQAKLDRTFIRMPFDGNILTLHLKDRINSYLESGKPFASVENTGYVDAQIQVREPDLQFVKIGMDARARSTSYFFDEFQGKVVQIDRNVTDSKSGTWVNVIARFQNTDGRLHTGSTGEAKIGPVTMPVWRAFSLTLQEFFLVDVWGWLP